MKVAFFEVSDSQKDYFKNKLNDVEVSFFPEKISPDTISQIQDCEVISIFVDSQIDKNVIESLPNLKMITTRSTGFDHIDVATCKERGIVVCMVPHYGDNTVAEHAFALMLDLSRKIYQSIDQVKKEGFAASGLTGFDLKGKTLGIIGMGRIGQHVARIAQGFEMNVLVYDVFEDKKLAKQLNFTYTNLEELLKNSDIITIHVPYSEKTHHLINSKNITLIKRGAYIINTARGGIIETAALVDALSQGIIAGAGLDVLEEEHFIKEEAHLFSKDFLEKSNLVTILQDHILMDRKNVIITPHNAFNSKEALERILETTVENIKGFSKKKPINMVTI